MPYRSLRHQTLHYFARPHTHAIETPIDGASAWRGDALDDAQWQYWFSAKDIAELDAAVIHAQNTGKPLAKLRARDFPLPTLAERIEEWRQTLRDGRGFVLLRGAPVERWSQAQSRLFYWCLGHHIGVPGAQNPDGDLLGSVRDEGAGDDARYYRTNKAIAFHCDAADIVGLLCLQPAQVGGLSRIVSSVTIVNEVLRRRPDLARHLFEPLYFDTKGEGGVRAFPVQPCAFAAGRLRTFWHCDYYRSAQGLPAVPPLSDGQRALLDTVEDIAHEAGMYMDMDLAPGDIQLLSNHSVLHARTGYTDSPDPDQRRHLLRLWLSLPEQPTLNMRYLKARAWMQQIRIAVTELWRQRGSRAAAA